MFLSHFKSLKPLSFLRLYRNKIGTGETMAQIDGLFKVMIEENASDLHLSAGSPPYFRVHGDMIRSNSAPLTHDDLKNLIFEIITEKQRKEFIEKWELDCAYEIRGLGRFRCNIFMQKNGLAAVFRQIPTKIVTLEQLALPPSLYDMVAIERGLILVTGPTGSGKSTTLAALINYINQNEPRHILTVEDPIEFVHANQKSLVNQREVSSHTQSFANALKAALREDPDVILVGELRDLETIQLAITAAETGHVVFGTLHTNSASKTLDRIIDVFPPGQQKQIQSMLGESLRGVISQNLLKRADGKGRVAAIEVLINNPAVANLIREGKTYQIPSIMQTNLKMGMLPLEQHLLQLVRGGMITKEQAIETLVGIGKKPTLFGVAA